MADSILSPDTDDETGEGLNREATTGARPATPRWVRVFGIIALALLLMLVVMLLTGGNHGPGRHLSPGVTVFGLHMAA